MSTKKFHRVATRCISAWLVCALSLGGCGGGSGPPVTYVALLQPFQEVASYEAAAGQLKALDVQPIKYQCGYFDFVKLPFEQQVVWADGRTPRLLFITVSGGDAASAGSIPYPGFKVVTADLLRSNSDPYDCDPQAELHTPPWGF
jgi:hypothetical protein